MSNLAFVENFHNVQAIRVNRLYMLLALRSYVPHTKYKTPPNPKNAPRNTPQIPLQNRNTEKNYEKKKKKKYIYI